MRAFVLPVRPDNSGTGGRISTKSYTNILYCRRIWLCCVVDVESPPGVDKTDQWLGVSVASQATDQGLALVGGFNSKLTYTDLSELTE